VVLLIVIAGGGHQQWLQVLSVQRPALLFRLVILISLSSGAVKDVRVIQGIVQLVYKILDNIWMNWLRVVAIRMAVGVYYFNYGH